MVRSLTVGFEFEESPKMSRSISEKVSGSGTVVMAERGIWVALQIGLLFDVQRVCERRGRFITDGVADILPPPPILQALHKQPDLSVRSQGSPDWMEGNWV